MKTELLANSKITSIPRLVYNNKKKNEGIAVFLEIKLPLENGFICLYSEDKYFEIGETYVKSNFNFKPSIYEGGLKISND